MSFFFKDERILAGSEEEESVLGREGRLCKVGNVRSGLDWELRGNSRRRGWRSWVVCFRMVVFKRGFKGFCGRY